MTGRFANKIAQGRFKKGRFAGGRFGDGSDDSASGTTVNLTGIVQNPNFGLTAQVGEHAGVSAEMSDPALTINSFKWGSTDGGSDLGTGDNPTDYTAHDGGNLHCEVAASDGRTYSVEVDIRQPRPGWLPGQEPMLENDGDHDYQGNWYTVNSGTQTNVPSAQPVVGLNSSVRGNITSEIVGGRWNSGSCAVGEVITFVVRLNNTWGNVDSN